MLISIIIPCYNGAIYIENCIESLHNQTLSDWEAVFINDGSKDNTLDLLEKSAKQDKRIKVYTQRNQGAAKAREYGLSKAKGDYITFLDVDDTLTVDALEVMAKSFDEQTDIVASGFNIIKRDKIIKRKMLHQATLEKLDYLKKVLSGKCGWELCAKMYRRELFSQPILTPAGIRSGEDAAVFIQLVCRAKQVNILSEQLYNYMQYEQSASHVKSTKYAEETLQSAFFIEDVLKSQKFYRNIRKEIDGMFLLSYSNSTRKGVLSRNNYFVKRLKKEHFSISGFMSIPFYKAVYVALVYYFRLTLI